MKGEVLNPVEMVHRLACCCTQEGVMASEVAVLTAVAAQPSIASGMVVKRTGLSAPNTIRVLNLLAEAGDVTFVLEKPVRVDHPPVRRHFFVKAGGMKRIRRFLRTLGWEAGWRFLVPELGVRMDAVEMVSRLACCCTRERLMASQVAVLTAVVRQPSITSAMMERVTGLSLTNSIRILNYLTEAGDVTFIPEKEPRPGRRPMKRHFYVTPGGISTVRQVVGHLGWGNFNGVRVTGEMEGGDLFRL